MADIGATAAIYLRSIGKLVWKTTQEMAKHFKWIALILQVII